MIPSTMIRPLRSRFAAPAVILLAAAVAVAPQLVRGNSCGHDFDFHLASWLDAANSWRHGIVYPHWTPSVNFGAGEPRFVFYPPLTWMLGAALGFVLPWTLVPVALTFLMLAATGLATRALARQALTDGAATLAGCAALFSGYALFTAYERSAYGELSGGFWIPLLLLYILRDRNPAESSAKRALALRVFDGSAVPLALIVAGAWLSDAPLGVMACYLLAAVALAAAVLARSWAPALRAAIAVVIGTALASLYLIPAAWEQRWVDIRQATDDPGLLIENSWLFARHANPALELHDVELHKVSLIAVSMIAVALGGLLVCWASGRLAAEHQSSFRRWWIPLALIPVAVLFLQFPVSQPLWNLLPKLKFLQFPWRWLVTLEAPMAICFAAAVTSLRRRWMRAVAVPVCAALFLAATAIAGANFYQACYPEDTVAGMLATLRSGAGFEGTDEYAPPGADNTLIATGLPDACFTTDPAAKLGIADTPEANPDWWVEQGSCGATLSWQNGEPEQLRLRATFRHAGYLILRLRSYQAWRIAVNGRPVASLPQREDGLTVVPVPQGNADLTVDWTTTPDVIAGRCLSVLAVLLLTGLWFLEQRLRRLRL
jgi:hypothetical protein